MVAVGLQDDDEGSYQGGRGGKRMFRCIASFLPNLGLNTWLMVELYGNGRNVQFLVVATAILALTRRYYRLFTGTIST